MALSLLGKANTEDAKKNRPDCERTGRLFDCTDWKKRQAEIRDSWSEEEEERRRAGELPNVPDNYSRFKK